MISPISPPSRWRSLDQTAVVPELKSPDDITRTADSLSPVAGESALQYERLSLPEVVAGVDGDPDVESLDCGDGREEESEGRHDNLVTTHY